MEELYPEEDFTDEQAFMRLLAKMNDLQLGIGFGYEGANHEFKDDKIKKKFNAIKKTLNDMINYYID